MFFLLSLIVSTVNEMILSVLNMRGKDLLRGFKTLLHDDNCERLVSKLYNHGQIFGLFEGAFDPKKKRNLPTYIPPRNFALALLDVVSKAGTRDTKEKLKSLIQEVGSDDAKKKLNSILEPSTPRPSSGKARKRLAKKLRDWFRGRTSKGTNDQPAKPITDIIREVRAAASSINATLKPADSKIDEIIHFADVALGDTLPNELKHKFEDMAREARNVAGNDGEAMASMAEAATPTNVADVLEKLKDAATKLSSKAPKLTQLVDDAKVAVAKSDLDPVQALRKGALAIDPKVEQPLIAMINQASGDASKLTEEIEAWYNTFQERVTGWYKYRTQWTSLLIGVVLAIGLNVDTVIVARRLSNDAALRQSLVAAAQETAKKPITEQTGSSSQPTVPATPNPGKEQKGGSKPPTASAAPKPSTGQKGDSNPPTPPATPKPSMGQQGNLNSAAANLKAIEDQINRLQTLGLPIGWLDSSQVPQKDGQPVDLDKRVLPPVGSLRNPKPYKEGWQKWPAVIQFHFWGWLLTAVAVSLGAPFWFDVLNRIAVVRSTIKPAEKKESKETKEK